MAQGISMFRYKTKTWRDWMVDGRQYRQAARGKEGRPSILSPGIRYNLLSMSFESYVMAILDHDKKLPHNHTFRDLVEALREVCPLGPELEARFLAYEDAQLCSLDVYTKRDLNEEELADLAGAVDIVAELAETACIETEISGNSLN